MENKNLRQVCDTLTVDQTKEMINLSRTEQLQYLETLMQEGCHLKEVLSELRISSESFQKVASNLKRNFSGASNSNQPKTQFNTTIKFSKLFRE
jgi:hypothetical protein